MERRIARSRGLKFRSSRVIDSFLESFSESSPFLESCWFGKPFLARNVFPLLADYAKTKIPRPFVVALFALSAGLTERYDSTVAGILMDAFLLRKTKFDSRMLNAFYRAREKQGGQTKRGANPS